jgi:hypothetical protein
MKYYRGLDDPCVGRGCRNIDDASLPESWRTVAFQPVTPRRHAQPGWYPTLKMLELHCRRFALNPEPYGRSFTSTRLSSAMHCEATPAAGQRVSMRLRRNDQPSGAECSRADLMPLFDLALANRATRASARPRLSTPPHDGTQSYSTSSQDPHLAAAKKCNLENLGQNLRAGLAYLECNNLPG